MVCVGFWVCCSVGGGNGGLMFILMGYFVWLMYCSM